MRRLLIGVLVILVLTMAVSAHSGRTDSNGGHKDNNNVSGLGDYHYHCGGYPAHLHTKGYCPYTDIFPTSVKVGAGKTELTVGEKTTLTSTVSPSNACNTDVTWESSNSAVISIKNDVATAEGPGTATITGTTFNGIANTFTIEVNAKPTEAATEKPADNLTEQPAGDSMEKPVENSTEIPAETTTSSADSDTDESGGSALLGLAGVAGIAGVVALVKRKR